MTFTGFTAAALDYFDGLAADNSRSYVEARRATYDEVVRAPMEELLAEAEIRCGPGKITRPHRDVRFSPDKSPYRLDASMWAGSVGAVYVRLSRDGLDVGGGLYEPSRDQLHRARTAIAEHPAVAGALRRTVHQLESQGFAFVGPSLKTAPRGFDRDHPSVELLRLQHYAAATSLPVDAEPSQVRDVWDQVTPLLHWVDKHAGARS